MNYALVLSGGVGSRMGRDIPKQYIAIDGMPMIMYVIKTLDRHPLIDAVVVIAAEEWRPFLNEWIEREKIEKCVGFADPGEYRQLSVRNGYIKLKEVGASEEDKVVMCEACRPGLSSETVGKILEQLTDDVDLVDTVKPIYEAVYYSHDGVSLDSVLDRTKVLIGMEPTVVRFGSYYRCNMDMPLDELAGYRGTIDFALANGYRIATIPGDANGFKITTEADLQLFERTLK